MDRDSKSGGTQRPLRPGRCAKRCCCPSNQEGRRDPWGTPARRCCCAPNQEERRDPWDQAGAPARGCCRPAHQDVPRLDKLSFKCTRNYTVLVWFVQQLLRLHWNSCTNTDRGIKPKGMWTLKHLYLISQWFIQRWQTSTVNWHLWSGSDLFSVALHEQTKILFGQFNCSVKLADVSTRCSSYPQGKCEARCKKGGALIGRVTNASHVWSDFLTWRC